MKLLSAALAALLLSLPVAALAAEPTPADVVETFNKAVSERDMDIDQLPA